MNNEELEAIAHLCELFRGCSSKKLLEVINKIKQEMNLDLIIACEGNEKASP